jgi:uncharacterized protein YkwD
MAKTTIVFLVLFCTLYSHAQGWDYIVEARYEKVKKERRHAYSNFLDTALNSIDLTENFTNYSQEQFRKRATEIINDLRQQYERVMLAFPYSYFDSIPILYPNDTLEQIAMKHAKYLVDISYNNKPGDKKDAHAGTNDESPCDRGEAAGYKGTISENIAGNFTNFTFIHEWLHSDMHRFVLFNYHRSKIGITRYKNIIVMDLGE